jgi:hypothetical protein
MKRRGGFGPLFSLVKTADGERRFTPLSPSAVFYGSYGQADLYCSVKLIKIFITGTFFPKP